MAYWKWYWLSQPSQFPARFVLLELFVLIVLRLLSLNLKVKTCAWNIEGFPVMRELQSVHQGMDHISVFVRKATLGRSSVTECALVSALSLSMCVIIITSLYLNYELHQLFFKLLQPVPVAKELLIPDVTCMCNSENF